MIHTTDNLPKHIAIIMDGNGRWATSIGKSRMHGHRAGHTALLKIVRHAKQRDIQSLTVYAFSSENWQRPKREVTALMHLFSQGLRRNHRLFMKHKIRFSVIGDIDGFSQKLQNEIKQLELDTCNHRAMTLNIAANYGGKWDIVQATKKIARSVLDENIAIDSITEDLVNETMSLSDQPPIDLLIRTGGEQRISNFLLWQCAYAEFYYTSIFWPEFNENALDRAIAEYQRRTRRFGGL